jgi:hypothetical protein
MVLLNHLVYVCLYISEQVVVPCCSSTASGTSHSAHRPHSCRSVVPIAPSHPRALLRYRPRCRQRSAVTTPAPSRRRGHRAAIHARSMATSPPRAPPLPASPSHGTAQGESGHGATEPGGDVARRKWEKDAVKQAGPLQTGSATSVPSMIVCSTAYTA